MINKISNTLIVIAFTVFLAACGEQPVNKANTNAPVKPAEPTPKTTTVALPADAPHWDYEENGPAKWASLSKEWATCGNGKAQSPIDIKASAVSKLPEIALQFKPADLKIIHSEHQADGVNNGHTIQVNYSDGDTLTIGDQKYALVQYHFHGPSEHTVNGKHFPMEMHLVHQSSDKKLAVLGVFIAEGAKTNAAFEPIWANLPKTKGAETHYGNIKVDVNQMLPASRTTYRYDGSLTTPPCSEGVKWIVFTDPIELSAAQIGKFKELIKSNNRPTQPLNGRAIASDRVEQKVAQ